MENGNNQNDQANSDAIKAFLIAENRAEDLSINSKSFYRDALKLTLAAAIAAFVSIAAAYVSVTVCNDEGMWSKYLCFIMAGISLIGALASALAGGAGLGALGTYRSKLKAYNEARKVMSSAYEHMVSTCGEECVERRYL